MHLNGPLDGELFMKREGIDPDKDPDDQPEWLDNEKDPGNDLLEDADEDEIEEDEDDYSIEDD
jgi:hypothetical protein